MNTYDTIRQAIDEAESLRRVAQQQATALARLLEGNLRYVPQSLLSRLKKELSRFNSQTGAWKP